MPERTQDAGGLGRSVRRLAASLLGLVQTRVELFSLELQEEKLRALRLLFWLGAAFVFGMSGVLVLLGVLAVFLWQEVGYSGPVGLAAGSLLLTAVFFRGVRRQILRGPQPFAGSVDELRKDVECLHRNN